jgi:hypothetical protein
LHAVAVTHIHYDQHGRVVGSSRRISRIVLIVAAVVVAIWLIGLIIGYTLFNTGGTVPGTGTRDIVTTP